MTDLRKMKIKFTFANDEGDETEEELPAKYDVCSRCNGHGIHTNPNIDGNGITSSEWSEWEPEEKESYLSGKYDVSCEVCSGEKVMMAVDEEQCERDPKLKILMENYYKFERDNAEMDREDAMTRRMERGYC